MAQADTLGGRNIRILALHRALIGGAMAARVVCAGCGTQNEFAVPVAAIAAMLPPGPDMRVMLRVGRRCWRFGCRVWAIWRGWQTCAGVLRRRHLWGTARCRR